MDYIKLSDLYNNLDYKYIEQLYGKRKLYMSSMTILLFNILYYYNIYKTYPSIDNLTTFYQIAQEKLLIKSPEIYYNTNIKNFKLYIQGIPYMISPICSIIGGIYAQEVLKSITKKGRPYNNFILYNSKDGYAVVKTINNKSNQKSQSKIIKMMRK